MNLAAQFITSTFLILVLINQPALAQEKIEEGQTAAQKAYEHYKNKDYIKAEKLYHKAIELDPAHSEYYLYYAIALYKNNKFSKAIKALNKAEKTASNTDEIKYYKGMIHFRLGDNNFALIELKDVRKGEDTELASSAAFYQGIILYNLKRFERSKESFEYVLDHSKYAELDSQAEAYLEKIAQQIELERIYSIRWHGSVGLGTMYDSNILFAPDGITSQGSSVTLEKEGGARGFINASLNYRPVYNATREFAFESEVYMLASVNEKFVEADPSQVTLRGPYKFKMAKGDKARVFTITPGMELLFMDANRVGTRSNIFNSGILNFDYSFAKEKYGVSIFLNTRIDDSAQADSIGPNDADASKFELGNNYNFYLNKSRTKTFLAGGAITVNSAKGDDKKYQRYELGVSYANPWFWDTNWNTGLTAYYINYPDHSSQREDSNILVSTGFTKPYDKAWSWNFFLTYSVNTSNVDTFSYNRATATVTANYIWPE